MNPAPLRTIGILLLPGVDERDVAGPWQVLSAWTHIFPDAGYNVVCVCHDGVPATCRLGLVIDVPHWFETMPPLGVLIHPGGTVEPLPYDQSTSLGCSINCNASWARGCPAASARGPPESTRCRRATVESAGASNRFAHPDSDGPRRRSRQKVLQIECGDPHRSHDPLPSDRSLACPSRSALRSARSRHA
jgi:hypothetical protein